MTSSHRRARDWVEWATRRVSRVLAVMVHAVGVELHGAWLADVVLGSHGLQGSSEGFKGSDLKGIYGSLSKAATRGFVLGSREA